MSAVRSVRKALLQGFGALALVMLILPRPASATPAYGRRYDTACATCHSPIPPRLNNVGMVFRRMGFRLPDSDETGRLTVKTEPAHGLMEATSLSASVEGRRDAESEPGTSRSTMGIREIEFVGGTPIDDHLSAQYMFLPAGEDGEAELEDVEVQANAGSPQGQFVARAGKLQTFLWQKGNHGSITPSLPLILDEEPMMPVGDFAGLALGAKQIGVEAGYTLTKLNKGKIMSTMLSAAAYNGVTQEGEAAPRSPTDGVDVLLQAYELISSRNNIGVFYYKGRTVIDPEGTLAPPGPFRNHFDRVGAVGTFAPLDWVELTGGGMTGKDKSQQLGRDVSTRGGYLEATGSIRSHWTATYRWEQVDPDTDVGGDLIRADVLATSCQAWNHLLLSAEYRQLKQGEEKGHTIIGVLRLVY